MAAPTRMILEAIAEVEQAIAKFKSLIGVINQLAQATGAVDDKKFNIEAEGAVKDLEKLKTALTGVSQGNEKAAATAEKLTDRLQKKSGAAREAADANTTLADRVTKATRAIQAFFASIVVAKVKQFIEAIFEAGAAMEGYTNALAASVGGQRAAGDEIQRLKNVADTFGLSFEQLISKFGRFNIAASSTQLSAEDIRATFEAFAITSRALGNSTEATARIFTALEQSMSKGVLQSEELKQQLGDSLPGAYTKLAAAMGITTKELELQLKQNKILAEEALPALAAEFLKTLGPAVIENATSLRAELERVKNEIFLAKVEIAEGAKPALLDLLKTLRDIGRDGSDGINSVTDAVSGLLEKVNDVAKLLNNVFSGNLPGAISGVAKLIVNSLGQALLFIGETANNVAGSIARAFKVDISAAIESNRRLFATMRDDLKLVGETLDELGKEGRSTAEEIAESANENGGKAKAAWLESLTAVEKARDDAHKRALEQGEALTKAEKQQLKQRQEAFESFFAKLADLAQKQPIGDIAAPQVPGAPDIGGAKGDFVSDGQIQKITAADEALRKLQERIEALQDEKRQLETDPYVTGGQLQRVDEINAKVRQLQTELARAREVAINNSLAAEFEKNAKAAERAQAAAAKWSQQIQTALVDLVRDNDQFRDSFLRLDTDGQAAVRGLISSFEGLAAAGAATGTDFQNFLSGLAQIFGQAGVITQEFAAQLQGSFGGTATSATELLGVLAQLGDATAKSAEQAAAGAAAVETAEEAKRAAVIATGEIFVQSALEREEQAKKTASVEQQAAQQSLAGVAASVEGIQQAVASGVSVLLTTTGTAVEATGTQIAEAMKQAAGGVEQTAESVGKTATKIVDAVKDTADGSVATITNTTGEGGKQVDKFGGLIEKVGKHGERSFELIGEAAKKSGKAAADSVEPIVNAQGKVIGLQSAVEQSGNAAAAAFEKTKVAADAVGVKVEKVKTDTTDAATASERQATAMDKTKTSAESLVTALDKIPTSANLATVAIKALNAEMQITKTLSTDIGVEIAKWADEV